MSTSRVCSSLDPKAIDLANPQICFSGRASRRGKTCRLQSTTVCLPGTSYPPVLRTTTRATNGACEVRTSELMPSGRMVKSL